MSKQVNIIEPYTNVRIISVLLLLPMYAGVPEAWSVFNKIIYPVSIALALIYILHEGEMQRLSGRNNIFALFLLYTLLAVVLDFRHGTLATFAGFNFSNSWTALVTALVSFLVITLGVTRREFLFSAILGLAIFTLYKVLRILGFVDVGLGTYDIDSLFGKNAYTFVIYSAILLLYISGKRILAIALSILVYFQSTRGEIVAFVITIALYHLHTYLQLKDDGINKSSYYGLIKFIVIMVLAAILLLEIGMAFNMIGDSDFWENFTSGRSVFYSAILNQWLLQGENIFYPSYPGCAAELASTFTILLYGGRFSELICSHSILIEMMVDYGIIIGLSFILIMVLISNRKGIFATSFFLINMSTQCEFFTAQNFVTYLLVYQYLSMDSDQTGSKDDRYGEVS